MEGGALQSFQNSAKNQDNDDFRKEVEANFAEDEDDEAI